jgi:microcystin-dependent protein
MDYWGTTVPNSSFVFPTGQAISRTTYAALFAIVGTTYGSGDGSTTFNLPDKGERVSVMKVSSASRLTSTYFGGNSTALGATGGSESQSLTFAQLPTGIASANASQAISVVTAGGIFVPRSADAVIQDFPATVGSGLRAQCNTMSSGTLASAGNNSITVTSNNTNGAAHPIVQPTIICNYIMRII